MEYIVEEVFQTAGKEERMKKLLEIIAAQRKRNLSEGRAFAESEAMPVSADKENGNG